LERRKALACKLRPALTPRLQLILIRLQKLAVKEYNKMTGRNDDAGDPDHEGEEHHAGGSDDEKKKKGTSLNRLLKTRLQKLVEKTDDECVFRLLPPKSLETDYMLAVVYCLTNSWISRVVNNGLSTTS